MDHVAAQQVEHVLTADSACAVLNTDGAVIQRATVALAVSLALVPATEKLSKESLGSNSKLLKRKVAKALVKFVRGFLLIYLPLLSLNQINFSFSFLDVLTYEVMGNGKIRSLDDLGLGSLYLIIT
jgi:hypothetical protein